MVEHTCPDCGTVLSSDEGLVGLCPECLLGLALDAPSLLVELEGDAGRGKELFFGERALCSSCHRFQDQGGDVGPDLTAIRTKLGPETLLDAILNPSAAIAFGYDSYVVRTTDGVILAGFVLAQAEE